MGKRAGVSESNQVKQDGVICQEVTWDLLLFVLLITDQLR